MEGIHGIKKNKNELFNFLRSFLQYNIFMLYFTLDITPSVFSQKDSSFRKF